MAWMDEIKDVVSRYSRAGAGTVRAHTDPHQDYCNIAKSAPPEVMAGALSHAFRSDQARSFAEMVSSLFQWSNSNQRAGLLNELLQSPALGKNPTQSVLAGALKDRGTVTADLAGLITAEQVRQIANEAQQDDPSIIDRVGGFYAQHPGAVKALGGAAIAVAIQHIADRR
jgi:hypothetical protein